MTVTLEDMAMILALPIEGVLFVSIHLVMIGAGRWLILLGSASGILSTRME
jgi:hypothetical protein